MDRRDILSGVATMVLAGGAGCSTSASSPPQPTRHSDTSTTPPETTVKDPPAVSVSTVDAHAESATVDLQIRWRARPQRVLAPPERDLRTVAEDGFKWLVVQLAVTVRGSAEWAAEPLPFVVEVGGGRVEVTLVDVASYFGEETLQPGDTASGWVAFHIPWRAQTAELQYDDSLTVGRASAVFESDASLAFSIDT